VYFLLLQLEINCSVFWKNGKCVWHILTFFKSWFYERAVDKMKKRNIFESFFQ
jgi:hypothetical protein